MNGAEQEHRRWLTDDTSVLNGALIVAASSVVLVFASLCVWRAKHHHAHAEPTSTRDHPPEHMDTASNTSTAQSVLTAALSSLRIVALTPGEYIIPPTTSQPLPSDSPSTPDMGQRDSKGPRSKERRRRGKDPYKDILKGGKKSKTLLKAIKTDEHDQDHSRSASPFAETDSMSKSVGNDTKSFTSRSHSSESASRELYNSEGVALLASTESDNSSVVSTAPASHTSSTPHDVSSSNASDPNSSPDLPSPPDLGQNSIANDSITIPDVEVAVSLSSPIIIHPVEAGPSYPSVSAEISGLRTTQSLHNWEVDFQDETNGVNTKPARFRAKPRTPRLDVNTTLQSSSSMPSFLSDAVTSSSPVLSTVPSLSSSSPSSPCMPPVIFPSLNPPTVDMEDYNYYSASVNDVAPSTPINSRGPTPPSSRSQPESTPPVQVPDPAELGSQAMTAMQVSTQTQLASMRGALEAARLREEKSNAEAERARKECEELRWRWNEDAGSWRRREAELQTHVHHLMQQLHAYAALASFQAQQAQTRPTSAYSSPTSPSPNLHRQSSPRVQHQPLVPFALPQSQNSASPPAHVHALLASPMLTSHHQGYGGIGAGGVHSGMGAGMSPLLWSGLGFAAPVRNAPSDTERHTPDSSASESPSRGRRRRRQAEEARCASDDSSLGDWDGTEESSGPDVDEGDRWERGDDSWGDDDIFRNSILADAILKRPESIRGLNSLGKKSGLGRVPSCTSVRSDGGPAATPLTSGRNRKQLSELIRGFGGGNILDASKNQESVVDKLGWAPPVVGGPGTNTPPAEKVTGPGDK
ncbi:hypothetical protein BU15DRAFT_79271 [Melanogaster broomeanus]|nr:hypothetical protein BU15DRAFT_79271 [Melanogaster broomeanus]